MLDFFFSSNKVCAKVSWTSLPSFLVAFSAMDRNKEVGHTGGRKETKERKEKVGSCPEITSQACRLEFDDE